VKSNGAVARKIDAWAKRARVAVLARASTGFVMVMPGDLL